jgi:Calcineurin-like phosphoesterase
MRCLHNFLIFSLCLLPLISYSQSVEVAPLRSSNAAPWTSLDLNNNPNHFQFVIVTDRTGGHRSGIFLEAVEKINLLQPEFVITVGDMIEGYTTSVPELNRQWDAHEAMIGKLNMPFFRVAGNHDYSNSAQHKVWKQRYGPAYYHFVYRDVLFLCLNSEEPKRPSMSDAQVEFAKSTLAKYPDVRWTMIFFHEPMWYYDNPSGWAKIESTLSESGRPYTVFCGHQHNYRMFNRLEQKYFILATTGGVSRTRGPIYGEFDHVVWVTMGDDGPIIANLMLDGIHPESIRTAETAKLVDNVGQRKRGYFSFGKRLITADPIHLDDGILRTVDSKITLQNLAKIPVKINARFAPHAAARAVPEHFEMTLPAGEKATVALQFSAYAPVKVEGLEPARLICSLQYEREGKPPLAFDHASDFRFLSCTPCQRTDKPVKIDGKLDEWPDFEIVCDKPEQILGADEMWQGPQDGSFRFSTRHDDNYLYIAVRTTDDVLYIKPDVSLSKQDSIQIELCAQPEPRRSACRRSRSRRFKTFLPIVIGPGKTADHPRLRQEKRFPKNFKARCQEIDNGMVAEIAIPASWLDKQQKTQWKKFRLNVCVNDYDEEVGGATLWWKRRWSDRSAISGTGTFIRR